MADVLSPAARKVVGPATDRLADRAARLVRDLRDPRLAFDVGRMVREFRNDLALELEELAYACETAGRVSATRAADDATAALEQLATVRRAFAILTEGPKP